MNVDGDHISRPTTAEWRQRLHEAGEKLAVFDEVPRDSAGEVREAVECEIVVRQLRAVAAALRVSFDRGSRLTSPALGKRHDARGGRAARVPGPDQSGITIAAIRTAEAGAGGQGQLCDFALRLVSATTAFDEQGFRASSHARRLLCEGVPTASGARRYCMRARRRNPSFA
jgi:hypothetical protein